MDKLSAESLPQNGFFIPFQTQITFWLLGGKNIIFDGGGTLDGSGQVFKGLKSISTPLMTCISSSCSHGGTHCAFFTFHERIIANDKCSASNKTLLRPITLTVFQAENVLINNIHMINGPEWHNLVRSYLIK